jgi:hypothetical protein
MYDFPYEPPYSVKMHNLKLALFITPLICSFYLSIGDLI